VHAGRGLLLCWAPQFLKSCSIICVSTPHHGGAAVTHPVQNGLLFKRHLPQLAKCLMTG